MNNGGPAFPVQPYNSTSWNWSDGSEGMTLRDHFAAKAMQGLLSASPHVEGTTEDALNDAKILAYHSYVYADAMLAAREKQN